MQDDKKKPSSSELVIQHLTDLINAAEHRQEKRRQKEERFRNGLGVRFKVSKPDKTDDKK